MANHTAPIPEWLDSSYIEGVLSKALELPDLQIKSMNIAPGSKVGDNYSCQIFRISTQYVANGEEGSLSMIGKYMILTRLMEKVGGGLGFFIVEAAFYETLLPKVREIAGTTDGIGPNFYYIDNEKHIMFLEDLNVSGFKVQDRGNLLTLEQCYLAIDSLATLHAASYYALKEDPSLQETFKNYFWSSEKHEGTVVLFKNAQAAIKNNIEKYGLSDEHCEKLLGIFDRIDEEYFKVCERQDGKLNLLLHGDCWKSNMMFRFNEEGVEAVRLVDFQIINYNSFANDLQYFLFSSVETKPLLENLDNILNRYYLKLQEIAPDMPDVSLERIRHEFAERYFFGVSMSIVFRGVFFSETAPDLEDALDGVVTEMGYADPRFMEEMRLLLPFFESVGAL